MPPETERLRFRLFQTSDARSLHEIYSDPGVMRYMTGPRTRETAEADIEAMARRWEESGFTLWAVELRSTGELIGRVGLWLLDGTAEVELGYLLARAHWGRGLATEAARACLRFGFEELGLPFIAAVVNPENGASLRVLEKLGFVFVREGRYYGADLLYHRLERERWRARRRGRRGGARPLTPHGVQASGQPSTRRQNAPAGGGVPPRKR